MEISTGINKWFTYIRFYLVVTLILSIAGICSTSNSTKGVGVSILPDGDSCEFEFDSLFGGEVLRNMDTVHLLKKQVGERLSNDTSQVASLARVIKPSNNIIFILDTLGNPCCFRTAAGTKSSIFDRWVYEHIKETSPWDAIYCAGKKYPAKVYIRYHI